MGWHHSETLVWATLLSKLASLAKALAECEGKRRWCKIDTDVNSGPRACDRSWRFCISRGAHSVVQVDLNPSSSSFRLQSSVCYHDS